MLIRESNTLAPAASESMSQVNANQYSELSILSSDDSIAMRKRLKENLAREFDNYFKIGERTNNENYNNGSQFENLSNNFSVLQPSEADLPVQRMFNKTDKHYRQVLGKREARISEIDPVIETPESHPL